MIAVQAPSVRGQSTQAAFEQLRDYIIRGILPPGVWMIEAEISNMLGMSRTPVRGALQRLHREGYVQSSGSGAKTRMAVTPLTQSDAQELYALIGHVEGLGARQTALLPQRQRQAVVKVLREINGNLRAQTMPKQIFELDLAFHRTLLEAASGPRVMEIHATLQPQAERYWRLYSDAILGELGQSAREHNEILKALREGDASAAEQGVQLNWSNGFARLAAMMASGKRGRW